MPCTSKKSDGGLMSYVSRGTSSKPRLGLSATSPVSTSQGLQVDWGTLTVRGGHAQKWGAQRLATCRGGSSSRLHHARRNPKNSRGQFSLALSHNCLHGLFSPYHRRTRHRRGPFFLIAVVVLIVTACHLEPRLKPVAQENNNNKPRTAQNKLR